MWGSIGFDGSRLMFGTGNTCQTPVTTANGAAALDLNGHLLWSVVAEQKLDLGLRYWRERAGYERRHVA